MKGVILAGGTGSRLYPLTKVINKHLIPVGNKPMIYYSIEKMIEAGITEILIISGIEHCGSIISQCGDGSEFGCSLTYKVQKDAGGIAQALLLAETFVGKDDVLVILGDNISNANLTEYVNNFENGGMIFLHEVFDPSRFGVAEIDKDGTVIDIVEKPALPKSNLAVTGFYIYDKTVFKKIKTLKPSARGELEITDVNKLYLKDKKLHAEILDKNIWWSDAGTFESLSKVNSLLAMRKK
jgi:glucose-1-phosphate thymidylyltransferase